MNNDMANFNNHMNMQLNSMNISAIQKQPIQEEKMTEKTTTKEYKDPMQFLGALGAAQVQMNNKCVQESVSEFLDNPDYVEAHVNFCGSLVEKGDCLEEAIVKTDNVFKILKDKNIYS